MKSAPLHLPVFQRFNCHGCTHCCRDVVVNVTEEEQRQIMKAGWEQRVPGPIFIPYRFHGRKLVRLAQTSDRKCIFLREDGRCRLHAETGMHIKPLPCRLFPFVPTPGVGSVRIDLRADCPTVARNEGHRLNARELAGLAAETKTEPLASPPVWRGLHRLSFDGFEALADGFAGVLNEPGLSARNRLRVGCLMLEALERTKPYKLEGGLFRSMIQILRQAAVIDTQEAPDQPPPLPERPGRLFRQWLFLHAIVDSPSDLSLKGIEKYRRSWLRYRQARRFAAGRGPVPRIRPDWPETTFEAIAQVRQAEDAALEPLLRSMRLKLDAHAFCGPGYYGYDVFHGLTALWLLPALTGWLARLEAVKAGHDALTADDVIAGLRRAHTTFGVSPVFARISERLRLRALARPGVVQGLTALYGP
ncbi:MAG TPA: YkgJ family cysteine cluster protein [Phycisphaerae bacterium]|jgi:lysine-N-methylase|nr:YkgJ family cysteine cluster protein [Phycisphaerae bacterium]HOB76740.1 YkgJ family cysteine cluster protein [Phycisphaerae bacterium]HOJ56797.1 YkgJ family cysteine cluster protein [Phycisphaerae bacterium]HOL28533.1 YkgJ family cysteine cluster protein [Phycisphaerae bacterium]HPP23058.1 YkgJ family cysteine cluster protein [Phycisphaerae bacterium]